MDSVEMYNCSQIDTRKAAIRFENAVTWNHEVRNSAFHNGLGWGANAFRTKNIIFDNNVWFNFRPVGVGMNEVRDIIFSNNFVSHVLKRTTLDTQPGVLDKQGGVLICSLSYPKPCPNVRVVKNIVAGSVYAGFVAYGHPCGTNNPQVFRDNVAHSINGGKNGVGALIYPDPSNKNSRTCYEASHFAAYKCAQQSIFGWFVTKKAIFKDMISIDNAMGIGLGAKQQGAAEYNEFWTEFKDSKVYGEYEPSLDCPPDKSFCQKLNKMGLIGSVIENGKDIELHPTKAFKLPNWGMPHEGAWNGRAKVMNVEFIGFKATTNQG